MDMTVAAIGRRTSALEIATRFHLGQLQGGRRLGRTDTPAQFDREIDRLASLPRPANGRRQVQFVHPSANPATPGLNPGVRVTLDVLLPGEETAPIRHNSTQVNFCIRGRGLTVVGGKQIRFQQYDVWNHPSYLPYRHVNDTRDLLQVRLTYSNAPLLEMLRVHLVDENPPMTADISLVEEKHPEGSRRASPFGTFAIDGDGAQLMPYETLISPPAVESRALHWPWAIVKDNLDKLAALGKDYVGRRLYLMYNPLTGRSNGTTPNFFATITIRPPKIIDRPHRHVSSAINYYFAGSGYSVVDGQRYAWKAGDLMVSAPGWAVHNHASYDEPVYELTVQDQPLHIMMESLLWQESMQEKAAILGSSVGFATNRKAGQA
jgi:gentisate 1,2-dioxygenase